MQAMLGASGQHLVASEAAIASSRTNLAADSSDESDAEDSKGGLEDILVFSNNSHLLFCL